MAYSDKVIKHYERPSNVGSLDGGSNSVGTGLVGAPECGDVMKLQIQVDDDNKIVDAKFKTFGCGSAIAASSLATEWIKDKLEGAIDGDDELTIRTELTGGVGKYGRLLGWLYIGDATVSLNEEMIGEGYAWPYDGGTKQKNFEELRELRRARGTLIE